MPGIKNINLCRHVVVIRFSAGNRKRGIISSPDNQHGRAAVYAKKHHHLTDTEKEDSTATDSNGRACDLGPSHDECPGTPGHSVSTSGDDTSGMPALPHGQHYRQCEEVGPNNELGCDIINNGAEDTGG